MRISDWSSDVCSSDLVPCHLSFLRSAGERQQRLDERVEDRIDAEEEDREHRGHDDDHHRGHHRLAAVGPHHFPGLGLNLPDELDRGRFRPVRCSSNETEKRSEEHTSELQSLMRISYAVFCFTKTNQDMTNQ